MKSKNSYSEKDINSLYAMVAEIKDVSEAKSLIEDLCSPAEIESFADRWKVVKLLDKGLSYREASKESGVSVTTVGRVSHCLNAEGSGYRKILDRIKNKT